MAKRKMTDAHEPNAGYDFHIVWTIRKCLRLLNFLDDGLKSVAVENLDPADTQLMDADGDILLGVDLTEYFGGLKFADSTRLIVSQLKYSTRHPDVEWTVSKMSAGKKGTSGSIINRLATAFNGFYDHYPREGVLKKLVLKLVSNRPISVHAQEIARKAKQMALRNPGGFTEAALNKVLSAKENSELVKLGKAAGLNGRKLADFLSILDFSDCNAGDRFAQRQQALQELTNVAFDAKRQFNDLHALVRSKTVPEARGRNTIIKEDILLQFNFSDIQSLFPVPAKFETLTNLIDREQLPGIKDIIQHSSGEYPVCIHGEAGIGKSTIARVIGDYLPPGSETILFDCYGGGAYRDPDDKRHLHEKAFLFLCNELAMKTGSPFLLERSRDRDYYLTEFKRRLQLASRIMERETPASLLAIIIDAADNSVAAADHYNTDCFIHDLANIKFPVNARLIVTSRTHRIGTLSLPPGSTQVKIQPFSLAETSLFLNLHFGITGESEAEEFRRLTNGIPRVMAYSLESKGNTLEQKMTRLKPGGKNLDDIFNQLVSEAEIRSGDTKAFNTVLTCLIALPRPVPVKYLISTSRVAPSFIEDFKTDLWKGLIFENDYFRFPDEDFETYLTQRVTPDVRIYENITGEFLKDAESDDYASTHLGSFLVHAGKYPLLTSIVLNRSHIKRPLDPVQNREIFIDRTRLAMKHVAVSDNRIELLQLQAVAAEASKSNTALEQIMIGNPELASAFGNVHSNRKMYFRAGNPQWFGRVHLRSAAVLSREPARHNEAKEHLNNAESWLEYRNNASEERRHQLDISAKDLSFGAEAYLRLSGVDAAVLWFSRWRPRDLVYDAIKIFIRHMLAIADEKDIRRWFYKYKNFRFDIKLLVNQIFFEEGRKLPFSPDFVLHRIPVIVREAKKIKYPSLEALISCAEQLARTGYPPKEIISLLSAIKVAVPQHIPSFYEGGYLKDDQLGLMDLYFRKSVLYSQLSGTVLTVDDFIPDSLKVSTDKFEYREKEALEREKKKFTTFYRHLLPVYVQRCKVITRVVTAAAFKKSAENIIKALDNDYELGYSYEYDARYIPRFIAIKLLDTVFFINNAEDLIDRIEVALISRKGLVIEMLLALAERMSVSKKVVPSVLKLLQQVDAQVKAQALAGSQQTQHYTAACIIASRVSSEAGRMYFDKIVNASEEIDIDAHDQIRCLASILKGDRHLNNAQLAYDFSRFVEYCGERLKDWEDFPWDEAVDSISRLHTPSGFAVLCRWDHRNVRRIHQHITQPLVIGMQNDVLHHRIAAGLFPLNIYYWKGHLNSFFSVVIERYDEAGSSSDKNKFLTDIFRDLKLNCDNHELLKTMSDFKALIESGRYADTEIIKQFLSYYNRIKAILDFKGRKEKPSSSEGYLDDKRTMKKSILSKLDLTSTVVLEELLNKSRSAETIHRNFDADNILAEVLKAVKPGQYTAHLDAVVNISSQLLGYWTLEEALEHRLKAWGIYPEVKKWKKENFRKVLTSRFFHLVSPGESFHSSSLTQLAGLFDIEQQELSAIVLSIFPDYIHQLSATAIYQLFEFSTPGISAADKQVFLHWLFPRWSVKISSSFGDGVYSEHLHPGENMTTVIGKFLRYILGHPDKRVRWRGAHCLKRLVNYGHDEILRYLINEQNTRTCIPFQNARYPYYWVAAKVWLWTTIYRLSMMFPHQVKQYAAACLLALKDADLPHAQLLWFIKQTCIRLNTRFPGIFSKEELTIIQDSLISHLPKVKAKDILSRKKGNEGDLRFPFDTLDTMEYWYEPLGRIFNLNSHDVARIAEKYIFEKWGFTGDVRNDDNVYYDSYSSVHHYKFDIPVIEDLRTYYEYHGMQCAAGELMTTTPHADSDSWYNTWEEWAPRHLLALDPLWLSELIDPPPLHKKFWNHYRETPGWEWDIWRTDLDEAVGFINPEKKGYLVINSDVTIYYGKDYEARVVESALTEVKYGPSLLNAVQTAERYDVFIPADEKDEDSTFGEDDIDEFKEDEDQQETGSGGKKWRARFRLINWIKRKVPKDDSIDDSDEMIGSFKKNRYFMGDDFVSFFNLVISEDKRVAFLPGDTNEPVSVFESWNNIPNDPPYSSFSSGGHQLLIKAEKLLEYLKAKNMALLLKSEIYRKTEKRDYTESNRYYTLFYLIYPNGKVHTVGKDFKLR